MVTLRVEHSIILFFFLENEYPVLKTVRYSDNSVCMLFSPLWDKILTVYKFIWIQIKFSSLGTLSELYTKPSYWIKTPFSFALHGFTHNNVQLIIWRCVWPPGNIHSYATCLICLSEWELVGRKYSSSKGFHWFGPLEYLAPNAQGSWWFIVEPREKPFW